MDQQFIPGTGCLNSITNYFDHISGIGEYMDSYDVLTKDTFFDAQREINNSSVKVFMKWDLEIKELENSLVLIPIDNRISFESDQTDVVFSATFLKKGIPVRAMVLNRYLSKSKKWNAKIDDVAKYNRFKVLEVSSKDTIEKAKISILDHSSQSMGYIFDNLKKESANVTTSKSIAYTAAFIADAQRDAAIVFLDKSKPKVDLAAAILLIKEAGGRVLKFDGTELIDPFELIEGCIFLNTGIQFETIQKVLKK